MEGQRWCRELDRRCVWQQSHPHSPSSQGLILGSTTKHADFYFSAVGRLRCSPRASRMDPRVKPWDDGGEVVPGMEEER
ncbi:hypothetical protein B5E41_22505 [Rhizobium esperanzae]|uniref:Uncharacterized protein n=1 Tax=Rhizobium esperanzae TaxID=1967781 RepID=A0A246DQF3_9HYPH|nr:hypothetical protein B5E41_22505 [Rhizobium esperanzae]